jgi:hypothetical protein
MLVDIVMGIDRLLISHMYNSIMTIGEQVLFRRNSVCPLPDILPAYPADTTETLFVLIMSTLVDGHTVVVEGSMFELPLRYVVTAAPRNRN